MPVLIPRAPVLACLLALLPAAGCGSDGPDNDAPDAAISPTCLEAVDRSDLGWIQDNIFTPGCAAFASCHQGAAYSAQGLSLEAGNTETSLINKPSARFPDEILVIPGQPQQSYLMKVLGSYEGPLSEQGTMPPNNPLLCVQKRDAIERWIMSLPAN